MEEEGETEASMTLDSSLLAAQKLFAPVMTVSQTVIAVSNPAGDMLHGALGLSQASCLPLLSVFMLR